MTPEEEKPIHPIASLIRRLPDRDAIERRLPDLEALRQRLPDRHALRARLPDRAEVRRCSPSRNGPRLRPSPAPGADAPPPAPVRRTLSDPQRQAELERYGFTVVAFLEGDRLERVRDAHAAIGPAPDDPRVATNWTFHSASADHKDEVTAALTPLAAEVLERTFDDHDTYLTTFITKWPGPNSAFAPHQDPTLVDERHFTGVTLWCPLSATGTSSGGDNGMLWVVPGSHRFRTAARPHDVDQFAFAEHEDTILTRHGFGIPMEAGEALVFDNRLIHFSLPNDTDEPRVVLSFGMRPREARCVMLRSGDDGRGLLHELPDGFYTDVLPALQHAWTPPDPPIAVLDLDRTPVDAESFERLCAAVGPAPRAVVAPVTGRLVDPEAICAFCGSSQGLAAADRAGRNNAQLVCGPCRAGLVADGAT